VTFTGTSGTLTHTTTMNLTVVAPTLGTVPVNLSQSFNVSGGAVDNLAFTGGGLDGLGHSYTGALLGASLNASGTIYSFGPMGAPDAVSGQTVTLPSGQYSTLKVLATGVNGNQLNQGFTITYTDGTTTAITQSMSDWFSPQNYSGETEALPMGYRDNSVGTIDGRTFYLYGYSFALNGSKTVRSIALPANRNVVVLAMTLTGGAQVKSPVLADLSKAFNGTGITSDGKTFTGGLDGYGDAYSGTLLTTTITVNNVQFMIGAADKPDVVSGSSSAISLPTGSYSSLLLLGTGVNGSQLSQPFKVTYSDGTSTTFTQSLSDWFLSSNFPGETTALTMAYRNNANGTSTTRNYKLYEYTFSLNSAKTVSSVTLPSNANVKVFAIVLKP